MTQLTQTAQSCIANVASRVMDVPADSLTIDALIYGMNQALVEAVQAGFSKAYIMEQWLARELAISENFNTDWPEFKAYRMAKRASA